MKPRIDVVEAEEFYLVTNEYFFPCGDFNLKMFLIISSGMRDPITAAISKMLEL